MPNTINVHSAECITPASEEILSERTKIRFVTGEFEEPSQGAEASTSQDRTYSDVRSISIRGRGTKERIFERVNNLIETAGESDWDGEGSEEVTRDLIDMAVQIVDELPSDIPMPHVSATPLGYVALDWEDEPDLLASLVILPSGEVAFSFHSDKVQFHGQDQWEYKIGISRFVRCFVTNIKPRRQDV